MTGPRAARHDRIPRGTRVLRVLHRHGFPQAFCEAVLLFFVLGGLASEFRELLSKSKSRESEVGCSACCWARGGFGLALGRYVGVKSKCWRDDTDGVSVCGCAANGLVFGIEIEDRVVVASCHCELTVRGVSNRRW